MKGKDMILSNFLSRQNSDNSNPSEIIPISFNTYKILEDNRNLGKYNNNNNNDIAHEKYLIQTCSQAKTTGSSWGTKGIRSKLETRKATCNIQTRQIREAMGRSRKSRIKEKKA